MKVSIQVLQFMLPELVVSSTEYAPSEPYRRAALFQHMPQALCPDVIYLGTAEEIGRHGPEYLRGGTLLPIGEEDAVDALVRDRHECLWFTLPGQPSLAAAFERLQGVFDKLNQWENELDLAVYRDQDIAGMVQSLEGVLDAPMVIWDTAFQFVATANFHRLEDNPVLHRVGQAGGWPGEIIRELLRETTYLKDTFRFSKLTMIRPPNITGCHCAARNFLVGDKVLMTGEAFFLNDRPKQGELELLEMLMDKIQRHLEYHPQLYTGHKKIYEQFIIDLLNGDLEDEEDIRERLHYINYPYEGNFYIFVAETDKVMEVAVEYAKNICRQRAPHAKIVEYKGRLVGLGTRMPDEYGKAGPAEGDQWPDSDEMFSIGFSKPFYCLSDARAALRQAETALYYGKLIHPARGCYHYRDYYVYKLLQPEGGYSVCCDAAYIYALRKMDQKKNMDNEKLFRTYLLSGQDTAFTASQVNLHKNTVIYRINQIKQKLNLDLGDPDTIFRLTLGLKAVELEDILREKAAEEAEEE